MFDLVILTIGKLKEKYFSEAYDEYLKRSLPYARIELVELEPEAFGKSDAVKAKKKEGERLLKFLAKRAEATVMILDERGKEFTSVELSQYLEKQNGQLIFVIGGTQGLSEEMLEKYPMKLALSKMTLPHELARVVLAEQIYRAATIAKGKSYHH